MEILNALGAENAHPVIGASTKDSAASGLRPARCRPHFRPPRRRCRSAALTPCSVALACAAPRKPRRALGDITNAGAKRSQRGPSLKPTIGPRLDPPLAEKTAAAASDIEHSFTCGAGVDYVRDVGLDVSVLVGSVLAAPCKLSGVGCMPKAELLPALLQGTSRYSVYARAHTAAHHGPAAALTRTDRSVGRRGVGDKRLGPGSRGRAGHDFVRN